MLTKLERLLSLQAHMDPEYARENKVCVAINPVSDEAYLTKYGAERARVCAGGYIGCAGDAKKVIHKDVEMPLCETCLNKMQAEEVSEETYIYKTFIASDGKTINVVGNRISGQRLFKYKYVHEFLTVLEITTGLIEEKLMVEIYEETVNNNQSHKGDIDVKYN